MTSGSKDGISIIRALMMVRLLLSAAILFAWLGASLYMIILGNAVVGLFMLFLWPIVSGVAGLIRGGE